LCIKNYCHSTEVSGQLDVTMKAPSLIQSPAIRGVKYLAGYSKIYLKMNFKRETTLLCPLFRVAVYAED
jgi:hypothetical protein